MEAMDDYIVVKYLLLADALERLEELLPEERERTLAEVARLLDLLAEVLVEAAEPAGS